MKQPSGIVLPPDESDRHASLRAPDVEHLRLIEAQAVAKVGSWETDIPTGVVRWSDELYRIFNVSPDHFQPTHTAFLELVHPDDRMRVNQAFLSSAQSDSAQSDAAHVIEHRIVHADGAIKFIEERWKVFKDDAGQPARAVGSCRDITEQKHNEQEFARISRLYAALSHVNQAIVRMPGRDELFKKVCDALVQHGGFTMSWIALHDIATGMLVPVASSGDSGGYLDNIKISTKPVPEGMGPSGTSFRTGKTIVSNDTLNDPSMRPWREKFIGLGFRSGAALCLRCEGKACGTLVVCAESEFFFSDMEVALLEKVAEDISFALDNILRQEANRKMEQNYRTLFEYAPEGIVICDSKGYYIDANPSICRMLGYTRAEMTGKHSSEIVAPAEIDHIDAAIEQIISTNEHRREWKFRSKDGTLFPVEVIATQLPDGALITMIRDLTDRKRAEQERENYLRAEAADRVKSAFLATMSHELRTPLNSIIGFTGIILQRLAGPLNDEQAKQLEMVRGSARHLLALISDILDLSKIEAGQLSINSAPFDISAVIGRALETVQPLADSKGLRLESVLQPDMGRAVGDQGRFLQILLNLLSNAIKFTDHGQVMLTAKIVDDFVTEKVPSPQTALRIRISDTGIGIKSEDMLLLFQPFRQLDAGLSRRHEGTGLGLSICLKLAELMGGSIRAESALGKGTTFTLTLPLKAP